MLVGYFVVCDPTTELAFCLCTRMVDHAVLLPLNCSALWVVALKAVILPMALCLSLSLFLLIDVPVNTVAR